MSAQPPPIPVKHRLAESTPSATPKRVTVMPPKKSGPSNWEALFRVLIVLVILVSVGVAYWSFFHHYLPVQKEARSMVSRVSNLSVQLDELERRWSPEEVETTRARYREVYHHLFTGQEDLAQWLGELQAQAKPLGLDLQVSFGAGVAREEFSTNLAVIPASISLEVNPTESDAQNKSPYERVLTFGQHLAAHGKRADLAELSVTGGAGSVNRAFLLFNLWAGDLGTEAPGTAATQSAE